MQFLDNIIERLGVVTDWFYDAYVEVFGWIPPFNALRHPLY
ncbi:hypothetical protein LCGC14_1893630, partial [marine sediment metagenome]